MTTAGLEPATFWCRRQSKPNALPLRQVALSAETAVSYMAPDLVDEGRVFVIVGELRQTTSHINTPLPRSTPCHSSDGSQLDNAQLRPYPSASTWGAYDYDRGIGRRGFPYHSGCTSDRSFDFRWVWRWAESERDGEVVSYRSTRAFFWNLCSF